MPALSPDLRKALFNLPQKEKDQLLARLVAQDAVLTEQLAFRLLEGPEALEDRRTQLRTQIDDPVRGYHQTPTTCWSSCASCRPASATTPRLPRTPSGSGADFAPAQPGF
ncbi:hypothetical protein [Hymenobacter cellulosilyticus]|uniref:Uncharacterized protein n=1 Tax=Hymenobacter cellulosilyticus TaxID=2932248 RepID=A0A8T9QF81_9BACT|nr:hypothetical protein [Hymenobacter cellulosilyticus]UOQ74828.1 hypothetical protein MUN79_13720 [Hymenobacter cellulosilyticus]